MDVGTPEQVDLSLEDERLAALHIGTAWKELRRGAAMSILRDHMFGAGKDALEPGQVDTLDLTGLAERVPSADDGRVVMVSATPLGVRRHDAIDERRRVSMATILGPFTPEERQEMAQLMTRLVDSLDAFAERLVVRG